jgi:hypothetical protein
MCIYYRIENDDAVLPWSTFNDLVVRIEDELKLTEE